MQKAPFDPSRLDLPAFIASGMTLRGEKPVSALERTAALLVPGSFDDAVVRWEAEGRLRTGPDRRPQPWLRLGATTTVWMTCQRCLEPVALDLKVERDIRFVESEEEAERLDLDSDDDVLASSRSFDLLGLIEDEILLALPSVPRHADCVPPTTADRPSEAEVRTNPFAVLRKLRDER